MKEELLKSVIDKMVENNLLDYWSERVSETSEGVTIQVDSENEEDYAVSSDGIRYNKKAVFAYLNEKGYQINQMNVDGAAKILSEQDGEVLIPGTTTYSVVKHNLLENSDENEIMQYINFKVLEEINKLRKDLVNLNVVEYSVEVIQDNSCGGTNINRLSKTLREYSSNGWKLKSIFTNELGVNSVSVGGFGTNSTIDQVVLIFERPKIISDDMKKIINTK